MTKGEKSSHVRIAILVLGLLLSMAIYCNQQAMSFTIICMQDVVESQSSNTTEGHWLENPAKKNALFSVVAVGQLLGTLPIIPIMHAFGLRYTFVFYGIVSTLGTAMLPLTVELGHIFVMIARIMQFSSILTMPLASAFCESSFGWRYLYYSLGIASAAAVISFFVLYRDDPKNHW
ncbi:hypothetical protein COOONC_11084 [Cooperia oncophora]